MKRLLVISLFVLSCVLTVNTAGFANDTANNAVHIDLGAVLQGYLVYYTFGFGIHYERALGNSFAIKVGGAGYVDEAYVTYIEPRVYFGKSSLSGSFIGILGGVVLDDSFGFVTPMAGAEYGYKWIAGKDPSSGFFLEPYIGLVLPGGPSYGCSLGFAF